DKVERMKALAMELCAVTGADVALVQRAAELAKMDLVTETVGEFPELQGQIGRQLYLLEKGADESIAAAIEDHYRPLGPNDRVPSDPVAVTLALADKLDTLVGFWKIGEKPTGSGDPYGLRRAGLGVIRIVLDNNIRSSVSADLIGYARLAHGEKKHEVATLNDLSIDLASFVEERFRVALRDRGVRHDLIAAVSQDVKKLDLVLRSNKVEALDAFLKTEDGANLLAGYKRAANIVAAEEKKGKWSAEEAKGDLDPAKLTEPAEKSLHAALEAALPTARSAVEAEDFAAAMKALSALRAPVDAFFEKVMVNADDPMLRRNRLLLLARLREALSQVADFSKIEG
ncbi:MAG TPA: glycine--tRNA ligase subunit beta, partial [Terricaulis sp.]|nr:glycine--tRNA ligase subunit beta [Terricaulis sp.]